MSKLEEFIQIELIDEDIEFCEKHAKLMCSGFKTYSFKEDKLQSEDVYFIGKVGELIFQKYLLSIKDLKIIHEPFRENYSRINKNDDFIVERNNNKVQIEVKTKQRSVDPDEFFECCTDSIKPNLLYVFISYNRVTKTGFVLGYADWDVFKLHGSETKKGSVNCNFKNRVNEFNIKIEHLKPFRYESYYKDIQR